MILYKYTSYITGLKILMEQKIRYTQPFCFNDPFELFPIIEEYFTNEQFEDMLEDITKPQMLDDIFQTQIKNEYDKLSKVQRSNIPYDIFYIFMKEGLQNEILRKNLSFKDWIRNYMLNKEYNMANKINIEYLKLINSYIGILSLSQTNNDILMWSHYCNSHSGVVLKLNVDHSFFQHLDKVTYPNSKERPRIKLSRRDYTQKESLDLYQKVFFSKSPDWSYEKEFRDYKALVTGDNTGEIDDSGFPIILFSFPQEIIEGVIFGTRVDSENIIEFIDKVNNGYKKLIFERALLDKDKFALNICQLSFPSSKVQIQ